MGKVAALKNPFGLRDGQLVHVSAVERGKECGCVCVGCGESLVARKGGLKVHHFAHTSISPTCSDESVLHKLGKRLLRERIETAIRANSALQIQWECEECDQDHEVNLVRKAQSVVEEFNFGTARADLVLLNNKGLPYIACEIVVTHEPEEAVRAFYRSQKITCVEFHVSNEKHLEMLAGGKPLIATKVDYCTKQECECGGQFFPRTVYVLEMPCWKCRQPMKASYGYFGFGPVAPSLFKPEELLYARKQGVKIERRYSSVVRRAYFMNICPHCNCPWGDNYAGSLWENFGAHPSQDVLLWCESCHKTRPVVKG